MINHDVFYLGKTKVIEGAGALAGLAAELVSAQLHKVLIVTDSGLVDAGHVATVTEYIEKSGIEVVLYDAIKTDPLDTMVVDALNLLKTSNCDAVIGLGGGSSLDVSKCVSLMQTNAGHIMEYTRISKNPRKFTQPRIPLFLIPTTSGTGSEVSPFAVITNTEINRKSNITSQQFLPDVVILDPVLILTLPQDWTAGSGMDALTHAIDAMTIKNAISHPNVMCDTLSLQAISLVAKNLRQAYANGQNLDARRKVMIGSHLAGMVLARGTGASHGLANMLSKYYHVNHGDSVGMLLPYCMQYNLIACPERFAQIAEAMGENIEGLSVLEAAQKSIDAVKSLIRDISLPTVSDYIKDESEIYGFLEESLNNSCNFTNARDITKEAAEEIFISAFRNL
jgi:alcohol dehydrogenase class IV